MSQKDPGGSSRPVGRRFRPSHEGLQGKVRQKGRRVGGEGDPSSKRTLSESKGTQPNQSPGLGQVINKGAETINESKGIQIVCIIDGGYQGINSDREGRSQTQGPGDSWTVGSSYHDPTTTDS